MTMRILGTVVLTLWLAACATVQNPINVTRLTQVESAYGIALSAANGYRQLYRINRCTVSRPESIGNVCARRSVVLQLQAADRKAQIALAAARTFVRNNPTLDAGTLISAAENAVEAMRQIEASNGVH